jgi:hypothetical protein
MKFAVAITLKLCLIQLPQNHLALRTHRIASNHHHHLKFEQCNVPVERLQVTFATTPIAYASPLQPGCYAAFFVRAFNPLVIELK